MPGHPGGRSGPGGTVFDEAVKFLKRVLDFPTEDLRRGQKERTRERLKRYETRRPLTPLPCSLPRRSATGTWHAGCFDIALLTRCRIEK